MFSAFIPLAFTFVCPTEIIAYSDAVDKFKERGAEVLFASTDSEFTWLAWDNVQQKKVVLEVLRFHLLLTLTTPCQEDYGVLVEDEELALRGIFIIDPKGIVRQITINDTPVGRSVDETLRLVDAFQFTEKYGEVCPANWQKGDATINPSKASEFFEKNA